MKAGKLQIVRAAASGLVSRLGAAYATLPDRADWRFAALQALWAVPLIGLLGWGGGFLAWRPAFGAASWSYVAIAFFLPALAEESLFRVALIPREAGHPLSLLSLLLFIAWHPVQSRLYWVPWHELATNPWFLAAVATLGIACTRIWLRTGSVWPCVLLHWSVVASWKLLFGAQLVLPHF